MSLALHEKKEFKILEELEERLIVALKESSGVSLLDASVAQDIFLDLLQNVKSLKEIMLDE